MKKFIGRLYVTWTCTSIVIRPFKLTHVGKMPEDVRCVAMWKFVVGAKKNSASELKVGKNICFLDFGNGRSADP
jgi:hypothetical protein